MRRYSRLLIYLAAAFGLGILVSFVLPSSTLLPASTLLFVAVLFAAVRIR